MPQSHVPQVSQVPLPIGLRVLEGPAGFCEDVRVASESSLPTHMRSEAEADAQPVTPRTRTQLLQLCATLRHDSDNDASDDVDLLQLCATLCHDSDNDANDDVHSHSLALHQPGVGSHAAFVEGGRTQLRSTAPCFVSRFGAPVWEQQQLLLEQQSQQQLQQQKQKQNNKQKRKMKRSLMQQQAPFPCWNPAPSTRPLPGPMPDLYQAPTRPLRGQLLQPDSTAHHFQTPLKSGYQKSASSYRAATSRPSASAPQWTSVQQQTSQGTIYQ